MPCSEAMWPQVCVCARCPARAAWPTSPINKLNVWGSLSKSKEMAVIATWKEDVAQINKRMCQQLKLKKKCVCTFVIVKGENEPNPKQLLYFNNMTSARCKLSEISILQMKRKMGRCWGIWSSEHNAMCSHTSTIFIPDSNLSIGITLILSFLFGHLPSLPDICLSVFLFVVVFFF